MPARAVSKLPLLHEFEAWVEAPPCTTVASRLPVVIDGPASPFDVLCSLVKQHASKEEGRFYTNLPDLWTARFRQALPEEVVFAEGLVARVSRMAESVTPRSPTELMSSITMEQQDEQQDESGKPLPASASAEVHGEVGTTAGSRLGAVSCDLEVPPAGRVNADVVFTSGPGSADAGSVEALPTISELEKINKIDDFRKRAKALGLDVRCKKPDGNGWAWRSREDVLKDCARKLAEAGGATLPIGTGSVPQTAGASSAVLRNSSTVAPGSASAAVHGDVGTAASSRLGAVSCDLQVAPGSASASASDMEPQWLNFSSTGQVFCQPQDQATFHRVRTMRRLCRRLRSVQSLGM